MEGCFSDEGVLSGLMGGLRMNGSRCGIYKAFIMDLYTFVQAFTAAIIDRTKAPPMTSPPL